MRAAIYAARRSRTIGRCFRPRRYVSSSCTFAPGRPLTSTCGRGTWRAPWPPATRLKTWPTVGRAPGEVDLVRCPPGQARVGTMLVVPLDDRCDLATKGLGAKWNQRQAAQQFLDRQDRSLDNRQRVPDTMKESRSPREVRLGAFENPKFTLSRRPQNVIPQYRPAQAAVDGEFAE